MSRRDDRDVIVVEREGGSSLWWFLAGGALGAGLALLFAPQSGEKTRKVLGERLSKLRDSAKGALDDVREALDPEERVHPSLAEDGADEAAPGAARGANHPERGEGSSARVELEQRLAEARARRHRALAEEDEEPVA